MSTSVKKSKDQHWLLLCGDEIHKRKYMHFLPLLWVALPLQTQERPRDEGLSHGWVVSSVMVGSTT